MIGIKEENLLKEISIKPRTLEELSKLMNLSERSIRYKIKDLNDFLKGEKIEIEVILKKNIVEMIGDLNLLDKITFSKFNSYIFSQDERLEVLTNMLFFSEKKFQIEEYQDLVGISESTFKKDWKLLREKFDDLDIKIINRKYYTALEADEENIRNNLLKNIVKYKINSNNLILTNKIINMFIDNYFKEINFNDLENLLEEISRKLNITMSDDAYNII
ncbi:helix-turn-helix domain-containing protein, partial [Fusobacterium ulcerans]